MKRPSDTLLNGLLSGREGLSRTDQDAVLAALLKQAQSEKPWWRRRPVVFGVGSAVACAAAALLVVSAPRDDGFAAKGGTPAFEYACAGPEGCVVGTTVMFRVTAPAGTTFSLSLLSDPVVSIVTAVSVERLGSGGGLNVGLVLEKRFAGQELTFEGTFAAADGTRTTTKQRLKVAP